MKITVCGSLNFTHEIKKLADELKSLGFEVTIPLSSERILKGEFSVEEIKKEKEDGGFSNRIMEYDSIRTYWNIIKKSDAVLIANYDKSGIKNYVGGNSFLEMGFAHVLNKKIFMLHDVPEMNYGEEIRAMQTIILNGDFSKISKALS